MKRGIYTCSITALSLGVAMSCSHAQNATIHDGPCWHRADKATSCAREVDRLRGGDCAFDVRRDGSVEFVGPCSDVDRTKVLAAEAKDRQRQKTATPLPDPSH